MSIPVILGDFLSPAVVVVAIWMIRIASADRMTRLVRQPIRGGLVAGSLLALLFASSVFSDRKELTAAWMAVFLICVIAPAILGQVSVDDVWPAVRRTFAVIGMFLGCLALSDYLLHLNPWTQFYVRPYEISRGFRAGTSLGHPLTTSLVASVAALVCIFPSGATRRWPYRFGAAGALIALMLTVSRGGILAVGTGVVVGLLPALLRGGAQGRRRGRGASLMPLVVAAVALAGLALSPLLKDRSASSVGTSSAIYRSAVVQNAMKIIAERPILGFGPGTSERIYGMAYGRYGSLENSAFQLMVSMGVPAFLLLSVGFGAVIVSALGVSRVGAAAGIASFLVSVAGFNLIDTGPAFFALISPLIVCAVMPCLNPARNQDLPPGLELQSEGARPG
jgi:O-antigen ligase